MKIVFNFILGLSAVLLSVGSYAGTYTCSNPSQEVRYEYSQTDTPIDSGAFYSSNKLILNGETLYQSVQGEKQARVSLADYQFGPTALPVGGPADDPKVGYFVISLTVKLHAENGKTVFDDLVFCKSHS